jgi:hypothetical protein
MIGYLLQRLLFRRAESTADPRAVAFARGLALGALVGAAIAGSTIWNRFLRERPGGGEGTGGGEGSTPIR